MKKMLQMVVGTPKWKKESIKIIANFGYMKEAPHFGFCIQFCEKEMRELE